MAIQLPLCFEEVPITCPVQKRYHAIAPCLVGRISLAQRARDLDLSYSTIIRWVQQFRHQGMPGLFDATQYPREPYTPERVIVTLLYYKCCAPKASDRELARTIHSTTGHKLHHETVHELLKRYFFWRYLEFRQQIQYPAPTDLQTRRLEMVKLHQQGWTDKTISFLLHCTPKTVRKWLRRWVEEQEREIDQTERLLDRSHARHQSARKVFFGAIHAVLELQKQYGYAGWFRIQAYLERDYGIRLEETTIKKIMRLNRQVNL